MCAMGLNGDRIERFCELEHIEHFRELEQYNDALGYAKFLSLCCKRDSLMVLCKQTSLLELERIPDIGNVRLRRYKLNVREHR